MRTQSPKSSDDDYDDYVCFLCCLSNSVIVIVVVVVVIVDVFYCYCCRTNCPLGINNGLELEPEQTSYRVMTSRNGKGQRWAGKVS